METGAYPGGSVNPAMNVRFGAFELNLRAGELHKEGHRIRLQEQPFQILRMLLESPGEVVSREEIRQHLWPDDTVVEFDHSINVAVKRLRDALRDSADKPRYIETIARRGYRFIGELKSADRLAPVAEPVGPLAPEPIAAAPQNELRNPHTERAPSRRPFALRPRVLVSMSLAAVIVLIWAGAAYLRRGAQPTLAPLQPLMRLDLDLGNEVSANPESGASAILSPDGMRLVYVYRSKLFTRRLDQQPDATELPGTEGARDPFFSPDGQWVAFFAQGKLKKVPAQGGRVIVLSDVAATGGGSWGEDGSIIAGLDFRLSRIPSAGGTPARLMELAPGEIAHRWPQILPGGKAVIFSAYTSMTGLDGATIEVLSLKDGRRKTLVRSGTWGRYLTSGHLVYINKSTLFAVPFDLDRLQVHGTATPVLEEVDYSTAWGSAQIDFSQVGTLVYRSSKVGAGLVTVQWLDGAGNEQPLLPVPGNYLSPTLSPDGKRLVLTSAGDIWVYELQRETMTQLTFGGGFGNPLWTPDGRYIVFRAARGMWWTPADGTGRPQALTQAGNQQIPWSFSSRGKRLAFVEVNSATGADIWTLPVETSSSGLRSETPEVFLQTPFNERSPMFSPDGQWMAYQSDESGAYQVYVQSFPDKHGKRQISDDRGSQPSWSRDGHELFFWHYGVPTNHVMVVTYHELGDTFVADKPRIWNEKRPVAFTSTRSYDPARDGKRVVALMPAETSEKPHDRVIYLLNFFDELRRRVPLDAN